MMRKVKQSWQLLQDFAYWRRAGNSIKRAWWLAQRTIPF